jgi:hypothetical protein
MKHKKIFEHVYKLTMATVHCDGTLVVVCDMALGASLGGIGTGVISWNFFRFLHFASSFPVDL